MDNLVIAPLQEGRVDGHKGRHAFTSQASCKSDCMLLGDAHIKGTAVEALLEAIHACAAAHGSMDANDAAVPLSFCYQGISKEVGVGGHLHSKKHLLGAVWEDSNEIVQIVTINGANVVQAQLLKQSGPRARDHTTSVLINLGCGFLQHSSMISLQHHPDVQQTNTANYNGRPPFDRPPLSTAKDILGWLRTLKSLATAIPSAAEMEVELWPAPNGSYSLSERLVKPDMPPVCLMGDCDVSDSKTGPQVAPSAADIEDDIFSQLFAQLLQLPPVEVLDVHWEVDCV
ncbi:MAG: hypothetical protein FRX49_08496 [Trebouxia sp. A1-2]|nr:MAG: hypothetical protein FRX49_08496 [Trebouxia sp. A1-2]